MQIKAIAILAVLGAALPIGPAEAQSRIGGCLRYGLGGAIAGHVAGGHRLKGALAGCAVGVLERRRQELAARARAERNRTAERPRTDQTSRKRPDERERTAERRRPEPDLRRTPNSGAGKGPYDDLGLDPNLGGRGRPVPGPSQRAEPDAGGFGQGGAFSRGQPVDPDATGTVWPRSGTVY